MPYGYLGQNQPNQTVSNSGVFSITDVAELQSQGKLGGSLELIEEQTVSNVTYLDFTNIQQNKYDVHYLTVENYQNSTNADDCIIQLFESGVIETASVYLYGYQEASSSNRFDEYRSTGDNKLFSLTSSGNSASRSGNGYMYLYNAGNSSKYTFVTNHTFGKSPSTDFVGYFGGGVYPTAEETTQIRVYVGAGTMTGTISLYGIAES